MAETRHWGWRGRIGSFMLDHPWITVFVAPFLSTLGVIIMGCIAGAKPMEWDSIEAWGLLVSLVSVSVTSYIFMYETNRMSNTTYSPSVPLVLRYELGVKKLINKLLFLTAVIVMLSVVSAGVDGSNQSLVPRFLMALLISHGACNLAVLYIVVNRRLILTYMSLYGGDGASALYTSLDFSYLLDRRAFMFLCNDAIMGNIQRLVRYGALTGKEYTYDSENATYAIRSRNIDFGYTDHIRAMAPYRTIMGKLTENSVYKEDCLSMCWALVSGRKRVEQHICAYGPECDDRDLFMSIWIISEDIKMGDSKPEDYERRSRLIVDMIPCCMETEEVPWSCGGVDRDDPSYTEPFCDMSQYVQKPEFDTDQPASIRSRFLSHIHMISHRPDQAFKMGERGPVSIDYPAWFSRGQYDYPNRDGEPIQGPTWRYRDLEKVWLVNYVVVEGILCDYYSAYLSWERCAERGGSDPEDEHDKGDGLESFVGNTLMYRFIMEFSKVLGFTDNLERAYTLHPNLEESMFSTEYHDLTYLFFPGFLKKFLFNKSLGGLDLAGADLSNASFFGSDLSGCDFTSSRISGSDLTDCNLRGCRWVNAHISPAGALFRGADLSDSVFGRIDLDDRTDLRDTTFSNSHMNKAVFEGTDMRSTTMDNVGLYRTSFRGVSLDVSSFQGVTVEKCEFVPTFTKRDALITAGHGDKIVQGSNVVLEVVVDGILRMREGSLDRIHIDRMLMENGGRVSRFRCSFNTLGSEIECTGGYLVKVSEGNADPRYTSVVIVELIGDPSSSGEGVLDIQIVGSEGGSTRYTVMEGMTLKDTSILNSILIGCNMRDCLFQDTTVLGSIITDVDLSGSEFLRSEFSDTTNVRGSVLNTSFRGCVFRDATIGNCDFRGCSIEGSVFERTTLMSISMTDSDPRDTLFRESTLRDVEFHIDGSLQTPTMRFERCSMRNISIIGNAVLLFIREDGETSTRRVSGRTDIGDNTWSNGMVS